MNTSEKYVWDLIVVQISILRAVFVKFDFQTTNQLDKGPQFGIADKLHFSKHL